MALNGVVGGWAREHAFFSSQQSVRTAGTRCHLFGSRDRTAGGSLRVYNLTVPLKRGSRAGSEASGAVVVMNFKMKVLTP